MWLANRHKGNPDTWHLTQIDGEASRIVESEQMSDRRQNKYETSTILIPFGNYVPYKDWTPGTGYTLSTGDFVFFKNPGTITNENIISKANEFGAFEVKNFFVVRKRRGIRYQIKVTG